MKQSETPREFIWRLNPYRFYYLMRYLMLFLCKTVYATRIRGREHLPESSKGKILVCNHTHISDPALLVAASHGKCGKWRFISKEDLFHNRVLSWLIRHTNGFPVNRDAIDRKALDFSVDVLQKSNFGLGIFPEGHRMPQARPSAENAKNGVAMLARQTKADIVPCCIYHDRPCRFRWKTTVRFGPVIPFEELGLGDAPNKRQSRAATEKIMEAIARLWDQGHG
jgi:1-acyl-sn-glycerol-3-phosphate acyltransferase